MYFFQLAFTRKIVLFDVGQWFHHFCRIRFGNWWAVRSWWRTLLNVRCLTKYARIVILLEVIDIKQIQIFSSFFGYRSVVHLSILMILFYSETMTKNNQHCNQLVYIYFVIYLIKQQTWWICRLAGGTHI